jgi:hypothetical protein
VIGFDPIVAVLLGVMPGTRGQLIDDLRVDRRLVGDELNGGKPGGVQRPGEEVASSRQITLCRDQHIDNLADLIDGSVQVDSPAADLDIRFIDEPAISRDMSAGTGCVDEQRREPLHPTVDRDVIDIDASLSQQFFHVAVGEP